MATKHWHPSTKQPEIFRKVFIIFFFSCRARCLAQDGAAEVERWRGWRGQRSGRRGRRRAFRRIALGRGARTKPGLFRQVQGSRSRGEGRLGWQEAGWASEGWASRQPLPQPISPLGWPRRTHAHKPGATTAIHRLGGAPTADRVPRDKFRPHAQESAETQRPPHRLRNVERHQGSSLCEQRGFSIERHARTAIRLTRTPKIGQAERNGQAERSGEGGLVGLP
jgi:hypothetical protein